jgi:Asp/Glu/hydantoin racemase
MSPIVCFFHTGASLSRRFDELAAEYMPETDYYHAVDESVIDELLVVGELTPAIRGRVCGHLSIAERAGTDVILDTCSSTSPAVDMARQIVDIPVVKVDDPMAERAVELGKEVGLLATAGSTVGPSSELVKRKATEAGKPVEVTTALVGEAFKARTGGDIERHDQLVVDRAAELASESDVLVLAQASMAHLESRLEADLGVPALSSPKLAMEHLAARVADIE